jgi:hypothetical protein
MAIVHAVLSTQSSFLDQNWNAKLGFPGFLTECSVVPPVAGDEHYQKEHNLMSFTDLIKVQYCMGVEYAIRFDPGKYPVHPQGSWGGKTMKHPHSNKSSTKQLIADLLMPMN